MQRIIIRTNACIHTGLGHLVRCLQLAKELESQNAEVMFILDAIETNTESFLHGITTQQLYQSSQQQLNEKTDATRLLSINDKFCAQWVIVDDYRLGQEWESLIKAQGINICVIDDNLRVHNCDLLVDMRWRGKETKHCYDKLISHDTKRLLGPEYAILAREFNKPETIDHQKQIFSIMIGDMGSEERCRTILHTLINFQNNIKKQIKITLVKGPFAKYTQDFIDDINNISNVEILLGKTALYPYLIQTDFYIGAAGGIIYQLLCLKIPALTFSLSENQQNEICHLEDIGHFLHLGQWPENCGHELEDFFKTIIQFYPRIQALNKAAIIDIDGLGAHYIAESLLKGIPAAEYVRKKTLSVNCEKHTLSKNHSIRSVNDKDINHYLLSRNLDKNHQNMVLTEKISPMHHYSWWFNNNRDSWLLTKNQQPCLYIWHEVKVCQQKEFLVGGWFVCDDYAGFQDVLLALNWQLTYCANKYADIPWIAVIQRKNKFVKLLNQYLGFQEVTPDHSNFGEISNAICNFFNGANHSDFHFVTFSNNT